MARKVLLIGWDAADWKVIHPLLDSGKMPCLRHLVEHGCMGNLATLQPALSPILWTSIATGKHAFKHGIYGFAEPCHDGRGIQPISNRSRKTKAIWNILSQNHLASNVVAWWPSHPAEPIRGTMVSNHFHQAVGPPSEPWPIRKNSVHPSSLADELGPLRVNPNELLAEHLLPFIPRALEIDPQRDCRLAICARLLAECTSVQAVASWLLEHRAADFTAVYFDGIDHFSHAFMAYHPPRQRHVSGKDFELYCGVVEAAYRYHDMMLGALLRLAGRETTVILVSDHGFHSDHLRPMITAAEPAGPAAEHRDLGIFVMHGPGVCRDKLLTGLSVLDIAPTLLALFGLSIGEDMDGRPILEAFEGPAPPISYIPSWDDEPGDAGLPGAGTVDDSVESKAVLERLVALGYLTEVEGADSSIVAATNRELRFNLACSLMQVERHSEAATHLRELYRECPHEYRFGLQLAICYRALGETAAMRAVVDDLSHRRREQAEVARAELQRLIAQVARRASLAIDQCSSQPTEKSNEPVAVSATADSECTLRGIDWRTLPLTPAERRRVWELRSASVFNPYVVDYLRGCVALAEGDRRRAIELFRQSSRFHAVRPGLHLQIGQAQLELGSFADAEESFQRAAAIDPQNPHAHLSLARVYLATRRSRRAAEAALRATGILYHYPAAHYFLGVALYRLGRIAAAVDALRVAVSLQPDYELAHRRLAAIYRHRLDDPGSAEPHARHARALRAAARGVRDGRRSRSMEAVRARRDIAHTSQKDSTPPQHHVDNASRDSCATAFHGGSRAPITIVSGLPRSGTSLVMQMLASGGLEPLVDDDRPADAHNPRGYFEFSAVKQIRSRVDWLGLARGKVLKVVSPLLRFLPSEINYQVLFVERDLDEVVASQRQMLGQTSDRSDWEDAGLRETYARHMASLRRWIVRQEHFEVLTLDHGALLESPLEQAERMAAFVGRPLDTSAMAAVVDPALYRNRTRTDLRAFAKPAAEFG